MLLESILLSLLLVSLYLEFSQWRRTASFLARHGQQRGRDLRARVFSAVAKLREVQP